MLFCGIIEKKELPADVANALPADVVVSLNALLANKSLACEQKMEKIDDLMKNVPDEVLEKLPVPPNWAQLPTEVRAHAKQMCIKMKQKPISEKMEAYKAYIATLPAEQQAIICKGKKCEAK